MEPASSRSPTSRKAVRCSATECELSKAGSRMKSGMTESEEDIAFERAGLSCRRRSRRIHQMEVVMSWRALPGREDGSDDMGQVRHPRELDVPRLRRKYHASMCSVIGVPCYWLLLSSMDLVFHPR